MAKKQKRSVSSTESVSNELPKTQATAATRTSGEFNPDYGYVIKDLKRIGLLAGSFFVILIVLSFFLR